MKIQFSPTVSSKTIDYEFHDETVKATFDNKSDFFNFKDLPHGHLESIESTLSINPIVEAYKNNEGLVIKLLLFIDEKELDKRLLYPKLTSVEEAEMLVKLAGNRDRLKEEESDGENILEKPIRN